MLALKDFHLRHHPESASGVVARKKSIGGIVLLVLVAIGLYWMMPELRRYVRMERM